MTDFLDGLNEPQRAAVSHGNGPLLIFAGAGSGKTRTLTHRIGHLIEDGGVAPGRILAVTFTNRAAGEMRERLQQLVGEGARRIWMGTFHAMCAQMLRISGASIGIDSRFVIFDADDSSRLLKDILKGEDVDSERFTTSRVLGKISDAKNNMRTPADLQSSASGPYEKVVARLYAAYQARLRAANALDFDDLPGQAVRLLQESATARDYWSDRFQHVLVDEFQDVNAAQFAWVQLLASRHRNICVVGDDDQSIYMWRGANVKIILDFEVSYPNAKVIRLEQNYRSTQNILDAAHGVISKNLGRAAKKLWCDLEGGAPITLQGCTNAQEEAAWVVRQIQLLARERKGPYTDFVLLCRVNAQSRPFEEAFMRARVPLRLVGTQRFYERKEIKDLIAYLKVLYNPRDDVALGRIINIPARGIGAVTLEKVALLASRADKSLFDTLLDLASEAEVGRAASQKLRPLRELLLHLQEDEREISSLSDLLSAVIERTDYLQFLQRERTVESVDRLANVQELLAAAEDFDKRAAAEEAASAEDDDEDRPPQQSRLGLFLQSSALEGGTDGGAEGDAATLMTLHSAKGLEFPVVFMVGMEQGLLPHARALWGEGSSDDDIEEERRLCYVGLTRAREQVMLSYAAQRTLHGRTESTTPSQFIDEVPQDLLQRGGMATGGGSLQRTVTEWEAGPGGATPHYKASVAREPSKFATGDKLRHPIFGDGYVVNCSPGGGAGEWVEIAFLSQNVGKKKLVVAFAPLQKVRPE